MICPRCKKEIDTPFCPWCGRKMTTDRKRKRRTSGSGNISKLSGRRTRPYVARLNGVMIGTYPTVREAEVALSRLVDVDVGDKYNWTFKQVYEAWYPEHKSVLEARAITKGTGTTGMDSYANAFRCMQMLHNRTFRSIRKGELQKIINDIRSVRSVSTTEKVKQLISQLYQYAIAEHIVQANLAESLVIRPEDKKAKQIFSEEDIMKIAGSSEPAAGIVMILLSTGARIGELFSVRLADCHEDYFVGGSKSTAGVNRTIAVAPAGLRAYHELRDASPGPLLIDGYRGNRDAQNFRKRDYYPLLDSLGIERKPPHATRHTFATAAVRAGVKPELLKDMLGHASYSTTIDIYTHQSRDDITQAVRDICYTSVALPNEIK